MHPAARWDSWIRKTFLCLISLKSGHIPNYIPDLSELNFMKAGLTCLSSAAFYRFSAAVKAPAIFFRMSGIHEVVMVDN